MKNQTLAKPVELIGEEIGLDLGKQMVSEYQAANPSDVHFYEIGRNILNQILSQPGCAGIRFYNAYNVVAAVAAAQALGVETPAVTAACMSFTAPFGRMERIRIEGRDITLALVKNPVAFNEMLRMLAAGPDGLSLPVMIAINDLDADGRDVSWLWDVDFELLERGSAPLATTGIRGADMANRLKYAGIGPDRLTLLPDHLQSALFAFARSLPPGESGFVLATYTAMLELRRVLAAAGLTQRFWNQ